MTRRYHHWSTAERALVRLHYGRRAPAPWPTRRISCALREPIQGKRRGRDEGPSLFDQV